MVPIYKQMFVQRSPMYYQYFSHHKEYLAELKIYIYLDKFLTLCLRSNEHFQHCLYTHMICSLKCHRKVYILWLNLVDSCKYD